MKRTLTLLVLVGLLCPLITWAQQKTITGRSPTKNNAQTLSALLKMPVQR